MGKLIHSYHLIDKYKLVEYIEIEMQELLFDKQIWMN